MIRKSLAAGVVALLALLVLPALPASASALAAARLTSTTDVFPGARAYSIAVTNNEASGLLAAGKTVNFVRINFPVSEAGITVNGVGTAPSGWTATASNLGTTQFITYRGGSLAPGATATFTFPAAVARPVGADLPGDFRVQVSSNAGGALASAPAPAGSTLTSVVRILEVTAGSVKPVAPVDGSRGVADRSGTAGQTVTYEAGVVNHASGPVTVTPKLTSSNGTDSAGSGAATSVPGNDGTAALRVPVTLGSAPANGQLARIFTLTAASTKATSAAVNDTFTVQAPITFTSLELTPTRTKSGAGSARTFTVRLSKAGVQGASVDASTFTFGSNAKTSGPLTFGAGAVTLPVDYAFTTVSGGEGDAPATVKNVGTDDNLATLDPTAIGVGTISIDNIAPLVTVDALLPVDQDGDQQNASSNSDVITVSGSVKGVDLAPTSLAVKLTTDNGKDLPVTVTRTTTPEGFTFTGTVNVGTWDAGATRFSPAASVQDTATNIGTSTGLSYPIDVKLPELRGTGVILSPTTIELKFLDPNGVRGGCDPSAYAVTGKPGAVMAVRGNGDAPCDASALSDGVRTLVLADRSALGTTETPTVTYSVLNRMLGFVPAKDGAGNDAVNATVATVSALRPLAPVLNLVERRDGGAAAGAFERAYLDPEESAYYTNAAGTDGNRVTVGGVRNGYVLQVRDAAGKLLSETTTFSNTSPLAPSEYTGSSALPVGTTAGTYDRFLNFLVPATGNVGPSTKIRMVVDQTLPTIATATLTSPTTVQAKFREAIVAGTDAADDWFVSETVTTESGAGVRTVNVNGISSVDQLTRNLTIELANAANYTRTDYFFQSPSGLRYEDRAGNLLASTLTQVG